MAGPLLKCALSQRSGRLRQASKHPLRIADTATVAVSQPESADPDAGLNAAGYSCLGLLLVVYRCALKVMALRIGSA